MIVPIHPLDKIAYHSCCVFDMNDYTEGTGEVSLEVDLVTMRGRYEKTSLIEV